MTPTINHHGMIVVVQQVDQWGMYVTTLRSIESWRCRETLRKSFLVILVQLLEIVADCIVDAPEKLCFIWLDFDSTAFSAQDFKLQWVKASHGNCSSWHFVDLVICNSRWSSTEIKARNFELLVHPGFSDLPRQPHLAKLSSIQDMDAQIVQAILAIKGSHWIRARLHVKNLKAAMMTNNANNDQTIGFIRDPTLD